MPRRFLATLLGALLLAACVHADELGGPRNVLFVGNSFTYYNNSLHNHYRLLLRAHAPDEVLDRRVRAMTISGGRLPEHAGGLASMLESDDWDVVVLQGHSLDTVEPKHSGPFERAAQQYAALIRAHGAEPVLFMTWAYANAPQMTDAVASAYLALGDRLDARVVAVGRAFAATRAAHPDIELYTEDGRHPSLAGTYLAACMFYASLHGASPLGNAYTAGLDAATVSALQAVAHAVAGAPAGG